jgi:replicative DNA helicase
MIDKPAPQSEDIEQAVIGAAIIEPSRLTSVIELLSEESFYNPRHRVIWRSLEDMYTQEKKIDILTLSEHMKASVELKAIGGEIVLLDITNRVSSATNIDEYAHILKQKHIRREFVKLTSSGNEDAHDRNIDIFDIIDRHISEINALTSLSGVTREKGSRRLWKEFGKQIKVARKNLGRGIMSGIPSGLTELDNVTNGFQPSDLVIIGSRPGMGKSAIAKKLIVESAKRNTTVLLFSMEMAAIQWTARIASEEAKLQAEKFMSGQHHSTWEEKIDQEISKRYIGSDGQDLLIIDDTPALTIPSMKSRAKRIFYDNKPKMIIVDYIQLMGSIHKKGGNREQEISEISRGLKEMAKEFNVPVVALSQLNRSVESRGGDMRPKLSDLRESGAIEQDADMVIFLYRPEYYHQQGHEKFASLDMGKGIIVPSKGIAELIISKHRHGALKNVMVSYVDYLTKFTDLEEAEHNKAPY